MALIHPQGWRQLEATGAAARRVETLAFLDANLDDAYSIYHGVHWTRVEDDQTLFGCIDFAIVGPADRVLLIEQAPGFLQETPTGLTKRAGLAEKHLPTRLARVREAVAARLGQLLGTPPEVDCLLYCPDYGLRDPGSAGIDPSRIVDTARRERLAEVIRALMPADKRGPDSHADTERIRRFLADELRLVPDAGAVIGQSQVLYTRLSGGLAHWARCIDCRPFRLRVVGTAGSGKTQLALAALSDARAVGRRPLYVCYNRPLADHIARLAPDGCVVATYHQLCDRIYRADGLLPDFAQPGIYATLERHLGARQASADWTFDDLIVDEGQDFQPEWVAPLLRLLAPEGRAWWLEDPLQNLYARPAPGLGAWVTLRADTNYRSPRAILDVVNRLLGDASACQPGSPITGSEVEVLVYGDNDELVERTKTAITRALGAGYKKDSIALITYRGREHSLFTPLERLGPHSLRAFSGAYDLLGTPVHTPGDLLIESVYRFKGQSAACVILTEIDFETLDAAARRKLFVGMTRATLKLILVVSERARAALHGLL